ncbi:TonB-dependent receptor [Silvibacterium acidisoli]|uniref:TonB-dependent receptor n=1 Tax=Acidobacteriaceae bacterium ZG23-2 TaxID=2883246 RepID=UPI00406CD88E
MTTNPPRSGARSLTLCLALLIFTISWMAASPALAQSALGIVQGTVVDAAGAAVPGAQLELLPAHIKGITDSQGDFRLPDVPAGSYTVTVTYVGFSPVSAPVTVAAGQTISLPLKLSVANNSEQILVSASRPHGEAEAINETRVADNIKEVMPSEVIRSLPNANVADAIGRLPGVTLYRIEGEGVYIQVRSTEPRLTNVTVDGITIPAPEPTVRQVRLDVIPSDMVDSIEMNKTLQANMDGNGIGGSVNLRTKEAGDKLILDTYSDGGYTPILDGVGSYDLGGTVGKRFGLNKRLGLLGNAVMDYNGRGIDNIQPGLDPLSTFAAPFYDNNTIREYRYDRTRYGFDGSADFRLTNDTTLYAHGFYSDLKDYGDKWYYEPVSTAIGGTAADPVYPSETTKSSSPKFYTSNKRPNASVATLILGGRTVHNDSLWLYQISASRSYEQDSAGNPKADFSWVGSTVFCNYVPSMQNDPNHPHFGNCDNSADSPLLNGANWQFKDITTSTGINAQLNLTAQTSWEHGYRWAEHNGTFEAGFKFTNGHQTQDATETVYDSFPSNAPLMTSLASDFSSTNYYGGHYFGGHYGQVSDFTKTQAFTLANYSGFVDQQKTAADTYPNLFHTVEQITAGYLMNSVDFGRLHVNTGLRIEATRDLTFGYNVNFFGTYKDGSYSGGSSSAVCPGNKAPVAPQPGNCYTYTGVNNNPSYVDFLPSVQLRYALTQDANVRAVYARGIARPDPYQLVPYVTEDSTASPISVLIGNPNLRTEHANNYDLLFEDYLHPLGLVQAGFFFKQLDAPQVEVTIPSNINLANFPAGYFPTSIQQVIEQYPGDAVTQYTNGKNAYLYGFEMSFQQHFSYLPGFLSGLGVTANYTYTGSKEKGLPLRSDSPSTIDQSPNSWRVSPTYDTKRLSLRAGLAYDGASVFQYSYTSPAFVTGSDPSGLGPKGPSGDIWTLTHFQVDAQASYRVWKGLRAVVNGLNLNDEVFGYYTGSKAFINQREFYKPTYSGGLRYTFASAR